MMFLDERLQLTSHSGATLRFSSYITLGHFVEPEKLEVADSFSYPL